MYKIITKLIIMYDESESNTRRKKTTTVNALSKNPYYIEKKRNNID